ncbi:cytochrome P460 family protein [Mucilaginibacter kameinonensis]|uniref:cytochrome P460 family protein n=1 Tax=Mucilaginibacter kameinonensis TaxID=452286 RepID=UPI0013CF106B|nr:cytochrome P460 family protein [Mucilaginibacter kameinonensis]
MKAFYSLLAACALMLAACSDNKPVELYNTKAALPSSPKYNLDGLKVITSFVNKTKGTASTLYGNDLALKAAIEGNKIIAAKEVFTLVTWKQQDDDHWFGAKIPSDVESVEVIKTASSGNNVAVNYEQLEGRNLDLKTDTSGQAERIKYILGQKPSVLP